MSIELLIVQLLNGLQYGVLLFLLAAGLTLVFGIMNFVNLAHGSLYMMGAYFAAWAYNNPIFGIQGSRKRASSVARSRGLAHNKTVGWEEPP